MHIRSGVFTSLVLLLLGVLIGTSGCAVQDPSTRLETLFEEAWAYRLQENPLFATSAGVDDYNDELPSVSVEAQERRTDRWQSFLDELRAIERGQLSREERIHYDVFERDLEHRVAEIEYETYLTPVSHEGGFYTSFARLPSRMSFDSVADYEDYLSRLRAFPQYMEQHIALMERGIERGHTLPRVVLEGVESTIEAYIVTDVRESDLYDPFESFRGFRKRNAISSARKDEPPSPSR